MLYTIVVVLLVFVAARRRDVVHREWVHPHSSGAGDRGRADPRDSGPQSDPRVTLLTSNLSGVLRVLACADQQQHAANHSHATHDRRKR